MVHKVAERTFGPFTHSYTYLEVLFFVSGILAPVSTKEHVVLPVSFVNFGCPEAIFAPLVAVSSMIHLSTGVPVDKVVTNKSLESIGHGSAIHIILAIRSM